MPEEPNEKLYGGACDPPGEVVKELPGYAELDVTTNFSFLRGASHPDELVYQSAMLGQAAMAITDVNSFAGVARAFDAARKVRGFQLIVGTRLVFMDGSPDVLAWPMSVEGYSRLCRLLTLGRMRAPKGECHLRLEDFLEASDEMMAAAVGRSPPGVDEVGALREAMGDRLSLAVHLALGTDDGGRLGAAMRFARQHGVRLVATNHVHYHHSARRTLQDVLTCVRHGCQIQEAGNRLFGNAERHLKAPWEMRRLFAGCPQAIERGLEIARKCTFTMDELRYHYPTEAVPKGEDPTKYLRNLTYAGARDRYPGGIPEKVRELIEKELAFISGSKYESYFLTVHDLVREATSRKILCQGRGSAANSAVCYCLGVTSVDPEHFQLVFERFASTARNEPPDIDIDFEHERREEIIQYVYEKYGRDHAGMTASLITYRGRSAVRDVGKVLGFSQDSLDQLAGKLDWWHKGTLSESQLNEAGIRPGDETVKQLLAITTELLGFPRHLSQHVGGMVISRLPLCDLVPIENAAMEHRTVIEWDKDDLDVLGLFKVDILALGMMTAISKSFKLIETYDRPYELHTIPAEDPAVYEMAGDADTVGVFQIESRAQMSMLPRLLPKEFYDLVIEVAIVRPGPIQGDMVHPYLQRREALRRDPAYRVPYPSEELQEVLKKTLGVPLFQEQAMRVAMVAAGFTGPEADELRRAMAAWKRGSGMDRFRDKFTSGMIGRGYEPKFADDCFKQIRGFGQYGFPESHAASFAKLVYASAWIKRHHPAAFTAALLNSQPMGFYAPAQLVRDAIEHGVEVREVDVNASQWDCTLEHAFVEEVRMSEQCGAGGGKATWGHGGPSIRLGMRLLKGMREKDCAQIVAARRGGGEFVSLEDLQRRSGLGSAELSRLAGADALGSLKLKRREGLWEAIGPASERVFVTPDKGQVQEKGFTGVVRSNLRELEQLPDMHPMEEVIADYSTTGLSLKNHPMAFVRDRLAKEKVIPAGRLGEKGLRNGMWVRVAGLVLLRQRPGTASGVVFMTLEDETGIANLIVWSNVYERYRRAARHALLLQVDGLLQREGKVVHIISQRLHDRSELLSGIVQPSRDFH